jgi:hypothetical protein
MLMVTPWDFKTGNKMHMVQDGVLRTVCCGNVKPHEWIVIARPRQTIMLLVPGLSLPVMVIGGNPIAM